MYEYIRGTVIEIEADRAVIDVGGIGYVMLCSLSTLSQLVEGSVATLFVHFHTGDDGLAFYGFYTKEERDMFRNLISVNRIGKKTALSVLSVMSSQDIAMAIATGNAAAFSGIPGIGSKTAARVLLELKEKISLASQNQQSDTPDVASDANFSIRAEAIEALVALGYDGISAGRAVGSITEFSGVEQLIKRALAVISERSGS